MLRALSLLTTLAKLQNGVVPVVMFHLEFWELLGHEVM